MKKTNVLPLHEIKASDIQRLNDYLEDAVKLFAQSLLKTTNGTIVGLDVVKVNANTISVSPGSIFIDGFFGELETPGSGNITVTLPGSGTRTDTVAAYYEVVEDMPDDGYVLVDVSDDARTEQIERTNTRKLGAAKIQVYQGTAVGSIPADRTPIATLTVTNTGITAVDNSVKKFAAAGVVSEIANAADNNATGIKASRVATANMLLALNAQKELDLTNGGMVKAASGNFSKLVVQDLESQSSISFDSYVRLNASVTGTPTLDAGVEVERGTQSDVGFYWRENTDKWQLTGGDLELTGGKLTAPSGSIAGEWAVGKTPAQGLLLGTGAAGTRIYSTSTSADTIDATSILTGLTASSGITITGSGHSRTIKANGILSIAGTGAIAATTTNQATTLSISPATTGSVGVVKVGSGISVDGSGTISNSDKGSTQSIFKSIGNGAGTTQFSATSNTDMLRFDAGSGLSLAFDAVNKKVTFTNTGIISASNGTGTTASVNSNNLVVSLNTATTSTIGGLKLGNSGGTALGTASPGVSTDTAARVDHVHPTTGLAVLSGSNIFANSNTFNAPATFKDSINFHNTLDAAPKITIDSSGAIRFATGHVSDKREVFISHFSTNEVDKHLEISAGLRVNNYISEAGKRLDEKYAPKHLDLCSLIDNTSATVPDAASHALTWVLTDYDPSGMLDTTDNEKINIKVTGYYLLGGTVRYFPMSPDVYGEMWFILRKNGADFRPIMRPLAGEANINNIPQEVTFSEVVHLEAGDYLKVYAMHLNDGAVSAYVSARFQATRIV